MSERWTIRQGARAWTSVKPSTEFPDISLPSSGSFSLKENPTEVQEDYRLPIVTVTNINGMDIDIEPCAVNGIPAKNQKQTFTIQHLNEENHQRLKLLFFNRVPFYMETNNYQASPRRGRRMLVKILEYRVTWQAMRYDQQIYNVSMTCRVLREGYGV
jgi:hypothetical protein